MDFDLKQAMMDPKFVSGYTSIPSSQLPRETEKLIGKPSQAAQTKGSKSRYSVNDVVRMRLGLQYRHLGVSPHRVRILLEKVEEYLDDRVWPIRKVLGQYTVTCRLKKRKDGESANAFTFLIGYEGAEGFKARLVKHTDLQDAIVPTFEEKEREYDWNLMNPGIFQNLTLAIHTEVSEVFKLLHSEGLIKIT